MIRGVIDEPVCDFQRNKISKNDKKKDKLSLFYGFEQERYHNPIQTSTSPLTQQEIRRELSKL